MKSTLSVIIGAGITHKRVLLRVLHSCTKNTYNTEGSGQETKCFSQCMQLYLITRLIALISELLVGLVNKSKIMMNAKGCTFLWTYVTHLGWYFSIKSRRIVLLWLDTLETCEPIELRLLHWLIDQSYHVKLLNYYYFSHP